MKSILLFLSVFLSVSLFGQNVYIPDANFKAYLVGNTGINTNGDTEIQVSEASAVVGLIDCSNQNISDLTGIEAFTGLKRLYCENNQLTSLDVSQNNALTDLICGYNLLTYLDLSGAISLLQLLCENNQLINLDVSQNTSLITLLCQYNQLTSLDVSQNNALYALSCEYNQLTSLDVSQNNALYHLLCHNNQLTCLNVANGNNPNVGSNDQYMNLYAYGNPNLTCIQVDDVEGAIQWYTSLAPLGTIFSENCNYSSDCFTSSLNELTTSKNLIQILDLMGRETSFKPNTPLIYVYDDGSTEKVFSVEY